MVDKCPIWVCTATIKNMSIQEIDFTKTLTDDQVYETIMTNYSDLSREWIFHQWNWMNNVYWSFSKIIINI